MIFNKYIFLFSLIILSFFGCGETTTEIEGGSETGDGATLKITVPPTPPSIIVENTTSDEEVTDVTISEIPSTPTLTTSDLLNSISE